MEKDYSLDSLVAVRQQNYREFASTLRMNDKASHEMKEVLGKKDMKEMVSAVKTMIAEVRNTRRDSISLPGPGA